MRDQAKEQGSPLWTHGEMIFRVEGTGSESDRVVAIDRPFALVGQSPDSEIRIGGPGINGVFDLIGRIDANTISLPFFSAGSYVSGGMTGDDALHVPTADSSGVWHRIMPNAEVHLEWFNAPLNGTGDDAPAVFAAIQSGSNLSPTAGAFKVILPSTMPGVNAPHFATTVRVCRSVIIQGQGTGDQESTL